jgi:hypothetical protein
LELLRIAKFSPGAPVTVTIVALPGATTVLLSVTTGACASASVEVRGRATRAARANADARIHEPLRQVFTGATRIISGSVSVVVIQPRTDLARKMPS